MISSLRRKFVAIIMALVGAVLVGVLGGSYASTWQTQHSIVEEALLHAGQDLSLAPKSSLLGGGEGPRANSAVLVVETDAEGALLNAGGFMPNDGESPLMVDYDALADAVQLAVSSSDDHAWDITLHVAWRRFELEDGWRVAVADTWGADTMLRKLAVQDLAIVLVALALLLLISLGLSTWVLRPVEQAWEQQRRFVADASHELKTPLSVIIANTQILIDEPGLPADAVRWVRSTADESAHMKGLVEELLELARTDETAAGSSQIMQHERVDFSQLVESAALEFDALAFERGSEIEQDVAQNVFVNGDEVWLERLCKILIDNACKYTEAGRPIRVQLAHVGKRCSLRVANYGAPIDAADLPHVFDRFYRTDKARSRSSQASGFGLGLAIAKGIATSHGGSIEAASDEADGTVFTVMLPAVA